MVERSAVMSLGIARWLMWWKLSCCQARVVASVARMRRRILAMAGGNFGGRFGRSGDVSVAKERERERDVGSIKLDEPIGICAFTARVAGRNGIVSDLQHNQSNVP